MKWDSLINLITLYELYIVYIDQLHIVQFFFSNATADDMPTKTVKSKVLHSFKDCFKVLTTKMNQ